MMTRDKLNQRDANMLNDMKAAIGDFNRKQGWRNKSDLIRGVLAEHAPHLISTFDTYVQMAEISLIHTELSEAVQGLRKDLMDDHLPHRKMVEVEMGDAQIRLFDFNDHWDYDLGNAVVEKDEYNHHREDHKYENRMKPGGKKF